MSFSPNSKGHLTGALNAGGPTAQLSGEGVEGTAKKCKKRKAKKGAAAAKKKK